jgi:hypothetical protein
VDSLKRTFREALLDPDKRKAFDDIVKGWTSEIGAMSYSRVPTILDIMLLTAVVDNRKSVNENREELQDLKDSIEEIRQMVKELSIPVHEDKQADDT